VPLQPPIKCLGLTIGQLVPSKFILELTPSGQQPNLVLVQLATVVSVFIVVVELSRFLISFNTINTNKIVPKTNIIIKNSIYYNIINKIIPKTNIKTPFKKPAI
jgi:hypothetical protein